MDLGPTQKRIVALLNSGNGIGTRSAWWSVGRISLKLRMTPMSVRQSLHRLKEREIVMVDKTHALDIWALTPLAVEHLKEHSSVLK